MEGLDKDFDSASAEGINRGKLAFHAHHDANGNVVGGEPLTYVCQLVNARTRISRDGDRGFYLDCVVYEAPAGGSPVGHPFSYEWYPDKKKDFKAKKQGELKRNLGAFFGLDAAGSTAGVTTQVLTQTYVDRGADGAPKNDGVVSSLSGRLARVTSRPVYGKQKAHWTSKLDFTPYLVDGEVVDRPLERVAAPAAAHTPQPIVTPAPVTKAFPPAGWAQHPADPNWYYEVANSANMKTADDLRKVG
jgi:hypothetical protein